MNSSDKPRRSTLGLESYVRATRMVRNAVEQVWLGIRQMFWDEVRQPIESMPEVVGDGGLLVDPADTEAIADSMAAISQDPELRASHAEKAFVQAHRFNWLKMAWLTLRAYLAS